MCVCLCTLGMKSIRDSYEMPVWLQVVIGDCYITCVRACDIRVCGLHVHDKWLVLRISDKSHTVHV